MRSVLWFVLGGPLDSDELKDRAASGGDRALKRWSSFSQILRRDPDLVAYYTFDNEADAPTKLLNRSLATIGRHDGILGSTTGTSPLWSKGRWGKGALKFGDSGETAVHVPANEDLIQTTAFSVAFWVKRSELTRSVHLLNQAFDGSHCFNVNIVGTAGRKESGLKPNSLYFDFGEGSQTAAVATLPAGGDWFFVTLILGADNETRAYIDGKCVGGNAISIPDMRRTEDLYLGKTSDQDTADVATQDVFHGWMDELAVFRRTLSDIEVQRMYEAGKPE